MKSSRFVPVVITLTILLALSAGLTTAQGPVPQASGHTQALVGSAFTYQGQLQKDGSPINATCAMTFTVYDDPTAGNLLDSISSNVEVSDGLFTQALDFGSSLFAGDARWLEVAVKCPGDAAASTLSPRQALTAAPYALSLRPGAVIRGELLGTALLVENSDPSSGIALYGKGPNAVVGDSATPDRGAVVGRNYATTGTGKGVYGQSNSTDGFGVWGEANSVSGYGVYGYNTLGNGVAGYSGATSGATYGVYGRSGSPTGAGVLGRNAATSGAAIGVYGRTDSDSGLAVYGYADATSGDTLGVYGRSDSPDGRGVYGYALATSGGTYGVYGRVNSSAGVGVYGNNTSASSGVAVYGVGPNAVVGDSSTPNYGAVVGRNLATTGTGSGVYGLSASTVGRGVYGYASAASGVAVGVVGETESPAGFGVYSWGDLGASGTKSAVVQTQGYGYRRLYALESPEVLFEDVGTAQLVDGRTVVVIDPLFAQTVNLEQPYQVFLTAQGEAPVLLWVTEKTAVSFTVQGVTLDGQAAGSSFDYRIIAKRLGYEDVRLEPTQLPPRAPNEPPDPVVPQEQP